MANPVGEGSWLAYLEEAARTVSDLEQRVNLVELYKRAVNAEPASLRLWLAYCDYFWSLWASSQSGDGGWSEQEQMMGREIFSFGAALDLWQQGYEAIKHRISDSHDFWNRWVSLELEQLAKTRTPEGVRRITHLYRDRLATPHLTWDETSQSFSSFLSEYKSDAWEETMKDVTASAQPVKSAIAARDPFEFKLKEAFASTDVDAQKYAFREYLDWELRQSHIKKEAVEFLFNLCCGLFDRALTSVFANDDEVWHEYFVFVSSSLAELQAPERLLDILRRAVQHCPWSGQLWNRYILCAEEAKLPFSDIESIKHSATSDNQLYKNGMESLIEMYVAWCGFLKRTALEATATDEAVDVADVGLRAALEDVAVVGKRLFGKDFQGDPKFRLERIYIQYLTEKKGAIEEARAVWSKLAGVQVHADNYDFWVRYYMWEMLIFSNPHTNRSPTPSSNSGSALRVPKFATAVLHAAVSRKTVDWPERVLEVYLQHCNDYELPCSVRHATDLVHKVGRAVKRRRQREEEEKAAAYAAFYGAQQTVQEDVDMESVNGSKRKREPQVDSLDDADAASKRQKTAQEAGDPKSSATQQHAAKRDRENATILVTRLPADATQTKVRQYFKDYGHINNITAFIRERDGRSTSALIEFSTPAEAQSALLRDGKYFGQAQISVQSGHDLTVYVANFPPSADDKFIRNLFKDCGEILSIRWPSLKVNTHRRFCYISFRDRDASAKAVAKEGTSFEGKYSLLAKYSDPSRKKSREGALAEGREVYISGLDRSASESDLRDVCSKIGTVTRVNIPQNMAGKTRGFAYVDFENKEQAVKAVEELNNTKFRSSILKVEVSQENKVKHAAKVVISGRDSASPAPSAPATGDVDAKNQGDEHHSKTSQEDIAARTIALMGLPDTVNDTRVRALVEPVGAIVQLVLQPSHGGAKIEFVDAATAGKAALQLDGMEFEGCKLRTGTADELRRAKPEHKDDRIVYGNRDKKVSKGSDAAAPPVKAGLMPTPVAIRRPGGSKTGPKRGLGFVAKKPANNSASGDSKASDKGETGLAEKPLPKSNADFKAMFLSSGKAEAATDGQGGKDA